MARRTRSSALEHRSNRLKLEIRTKPHTVMVAPRVHLAYRRNQEGHPGSWSVKAHGWLRKFALADDYEDSNGSTVLDYWGALAKAKELARADDGATNGAPISVLQAVQDYEMELRSRGGSTYNATTIIRCHLPETFASKTVALLRERDLRDWRTQLLAKGLKASSADRLAKSLKSALNLAATNHVSIGNAVAWREGLKRPDDEDAKPRNIILSDAQVTAVVREAYRDGGDVGLLIETLAETGQRESQLYRLVVDDLQDDNPAAPRLNMPSSRKGKNRKKNRKIERRQITISPRLAQLLRLQARGRALDAPLFDEIEKLSSRHFAPIAERLKFDAEATPYALRHSSIVRQLLRNVPIRVVAAHHDTSVAEIERTYSRYIVGNPSDALTRAALLDFDISPASAEVIQFARP